MDPRERCIARGTGCGVQVAAATGVSSSCTGSKAWPTRTGNTTGASTRTTRAERATVASRPRMPNAATMTTPPPAKAVNEPARAGAIPVTASTNPASRISDTRPRKRRNRRSFETGDSGTRGAAAAATAAAARRTSRAASATACASARSVCSARARTRCCSATVRAVASSRTWCGTSAVSARMRSVCCSRTAFFSVAWYCLRRDQVGIR
ncbi:hypothetical protein E3T31_15725 [Cryobacterium sp. TMS1-13-1]|nr:hypothetical protein E3T31_15725 [Cryobacterium sp. TMS1-13-1]